MVGSDKGPTGRVFDSVSVTVTLNSDGRTMRIVEEFPNRTVTTNYTYVTTT